MFLGAVNITRTHKWVTSFYVILSLPLLLTSPKLSLFNVLVVVVVNQELLCSCFTPLCHIRKNGLFCHQDKMAELV
jgi:hypothetical protein